MAERGPAERAYAFVLYNFVVQAAVGWLGVPWGWVALSPFDWVLVASMGALALSGHFGITLAFQRAPVSVVAPFEYTALVWATVLGFVVFGDFPSAAVWFGVLVIVVSGLYSIYHENP
jgi:drug/metabolite transporter (DMT)-like permease